MTFKYLTLLMLMLFSSITVAQDDPNLADAPIDLIPKGYVLFEALKGDLNKDGQQDYVFIIKGTSKKYFEQDEYRGLVDRNRRGVLIFFKKNKEYQLVLQNMSCFTSENEDGGVYFPPELRPTINKGRLFFNYFHGRYGYWTYNFRYQKGEFELIGYDSSNNRGPVVEQVTSINFLSQKILKKENINYSDEGGDERFEETWKKFKQEKPILLKEITDFYNIDLPS